jgi:hypothetical protein
MNDEEERAEHISGGRGEFSRSSKCKGPGAGVSFTDQKVKQHGLGQ